MSVPQPAPKPESQRVAVLSSTSTTVENYPNLFMSPFGNDGVIPVYSSIPIVADGSTACLPCVVCGNSTRALEIITIEASRLQSQFDTGVVLGLSN